MADTSYRGAPRPHPTGYMRPEAMHEAIIVNNTQRDLPVNRISVPLLMVLIGAVALVGATYTATTQFSEIKIAIERLSDKLSSELGNQSGRIGRLEAEMQARTQDRFTKTEHELWCSRTEQANVNTGWKCAQLDGRVQFAPRVNGWEQRK